MTLNNQGKIMSSRFYTFVSTLLLLILSGCSQSPLGFNELKLEEGESGIVPHGQVGQLPEQDGVVTWVRADDGRVDAYVRKRLSCPNHASRSLTSVEQKSEHIVLCYSLLIDAPDQVTSLYGTCPQDLILKYEFYGIPKTLEPKFIAQEGVCPISQP
jgi:hypothetical protein